MAVPLRTATVTEEGLNAPPWLECCACGALLVRVPALADDLLPLPEFDVITTSTATTPAAASAPITSTSVRRDPDLGGGALRGGVTAGRAAAAGAAERICRLGGA